MKAFLIFLAFAITITTNAATITVVNNNDSGVGSLRDALNSALNGDLINFNISGVIKISTPLDISKDITISGPGANKLAIDGDSVTVIFRDGNNLLNKVSIADLEIRNGYSTTNGAGISALNISLIIKRCYIHSNIVSGSSRYGAGIFARNGSSIQIDASTISNNTSVIGGGIGMLEGGKLYIVNSTFYANQGKDGQAIYVEGTDIELLNVSMAGHKSGNTVININDHVILLIVSDAAAFKTTNSLFDNVTINYLYTPYLLNGQNETSNGYNISNDNSMSSALYHSTDLNKTSSILDPSGLQMNGGTTPTVDLSCSSPAINAGTSTGATSEDQRGFSRLGTTDIGAVESRNVSSYRALKVTECEKYTSPSGKYTWTTSSNFMDTIPNAVGCDSIMDIYLTIAPILEAGDIKTN